MDLAPFGMKLFIYIIQGQDAHLCLLSCCTSYNDCGAGGYGQMKRLAQDRNAWRDSA